MVSTPDPTTAKKAAKNCKAPTDDSELRELLGASHTLGGTGTGKPPGSSNSRQAGVRDAEIARPMLTHLADNPVDTDRVLREGTEEKERKNLASLLEMALDATRSRCRPILQDPGDVQRSAGT
ncbi:hypothetical protein MJO28_008036 [Puccinia striiformis f. sp. tritici]|nr:hypothetical protein MJO28_008036 [Puccinia striiformis f. sp. tritici]POV96140.1 hypothetical protein PSHT_15292 [Puccinia striiformis]